MESAGPVAIGKPGKAQNHDETAKNVNVQNVVMEGYILQRAPKSSPSPASNALKFRARLNFLRLQYSNGLFVPLSYPPSHKSYMSYMSHVSSQSYA